VKNISCNDILTVRIFGQTYKFKFESTHIQPESAVKLLLDEIEKIESEQSDSRGVNNKIVILIMAALNLAVENVELRQFRDNILHDITNRSEHLIRLLDENIV
jgi:cell division protein ZapA (FtsZ GTPase activity inhibitor)